MSFWKNKRVFLTGHTGFKGSWLALWLQQIGASVCGYSLEPPTTPSLFVDAQVAQGMRSIIADILDLGQLRQRMAEWEPDVVIHMAAQPLVRNSYDDPVGTYAVNVLGTVNLLEAVRGCGSVKSVVVITTDKCYENKEWSWGYRETDTLGGFDPYSNSKACAELVVSAYRSSFFNRNSHSVHGAAIASVRAGNVIGGGDWAKDRLVPDLVRALAAGETLVLRNPGATRPWQHVLEPLRGYLQVAERLYNDGSCFATAFNFGPEYRDIQPVSHIVHRMTQIWGGESDWEQDAKPQPHEAQTLKLDWSRAADVLGWKPALSLDQALEFTADWYRTWTQHGSMREFTLQQIAQYYELSDAVERRG